MTANEKSTYSKFSLIEQFLEERNWTVGKITDTLKKYVPPKELGFEDSFGILIPKEGQANQSEKYFHDLSKLVTEIYQKEFVDFICYTNDDSILPWTIRSRLVDSNIGKGTIPLRKLDKFVSNLSKSLLEIAKFKLPADEMSQKFCAEKFIDSCEFLPTESGSFVASVKVAPEIIKDGDLFSDPIRSHEILLGWFSALDFLNNSVVKNDRVTSDIDSVISSAFEVLNLSAAEALESLITDTHIKNYEFELTSGIKKIVSSTGDLNKASISRLEDFIKIFKDKLTNEDEIEIEGKILELRSRNPSGNRNHVTVSTDFYGDAVLVSMNLNNEDYQKACEAHQKQKTVLITGNAIRLKTQLRINKLSSFDIK